MLVLATGYNLWFYIMRMTDEMKFEKGPEAEPASTGRNADGEPVGLGVPVLPLDPVLRKRFADMDTIRDKEESGIVDSRFSPAGNPRPTALKPVGRRGSHVETDVTKPATERDYEMAREMMSRGLPPTRVAQATGLSELVVKKLAR